MKFPVHGGDVYRNNVKLDFSVNVNPIGVDKKIKSKLNYSVDDIERYPDPEQAKLRIALAEKFGISEDNIICGNGASELFVAIVHAIRPKRVVCPVPSFYGYERAAWACGAELRCYPLKKEKGFTLDSEFLTFLKPDVDLVFLANPNNPVGNRIDSEFLIDVLDTCLENDIYVVLDECFIEFLNHNYYDMRARLKRYQNLMVVRAFTKYYAIPGIRLGYLLCDNENLMSRIKLQLPEWNISALAEAAGLAALSCEASYANTSIIVRRERSNMETFLKRAFSEHGYELEIIEGEANFMLIKTDIDLYTRLLNRGVLIRDCSDFRGLEQGYYRIAIKNHDMNEEFIKIVEECLDD